MSSKWEVSAGGVVVRGDETVVIVPRKPGPEGQRTLALPKGHPDAGETMEEAATRFDFQFGQFPLGHFVVGLIVEGDSLFSGGQFSGGAEEQYNGACFRVADAVHNSVYVDGLFGQFDHANQNCTR